jgi:hypothetical protein
MTLMSPNEYCTTIWSQESLSVHAQAVWIIFHSRKKERRCRIEREKISSLVEIIGNSGKLQISTSRVQTNPIAYHVDAVWLSL